METPTQENSIDRRRQEAEERLALHKMLAEEVYLASIAEGMTGDDAAQALLPLLGVPFETVKTTRYRLQREGYVIQPDVTMPPMLSEEGEVRLAAVAHADELREMVRTLQEKEERLRAIGCQILENFAHA